MNVEVVFDVPLYSCKMFTSNNRFSWVYGLEANVWMFNKVKPFPLSFTYFQGSK